MKTAWTLVIALIVGFVGPAVAGPVTSGLLVMDNEALTLAGSLSGRLGVRSGVTLPVSPIRPPGIVQEPAYHGTPYYGVIRVGDGSQADTVFVMDHAPDERREDNRLYFDRNQNGDLTDDGDGVMQSVGKSLAGARVGPHFDIVRASWGTDTTETSTAEYGLMFLFGVDRSGDNPSMMTRTAAVRAGSIALDGRDVRIALVETSATGNFDISTAVSPTRENFADRTLRTMTLLVDVDGNGSFGATEVFDACRPFRVGAVTYRASATRDGTRVSFHPTDQAAQVIKPPAPANNTKDSGLLPSGTMAPDFTVIDTEGREVKLSDFRGKTVVLDFWATWCIPCIRAMPHVQKTVARAQEDGEVVWLGVCVWDDQALFKRWVSANDAKYDFVKVFDPAGKNRATSIASQLYAVTGIPTLYVIDEEGRIVAGAVGYTGDDDDRLAQALRKARPAR